MLQCIESRCAGGCPVKLGILLAHISQGSSHIGIALNKLDEEVSKTEKLQHLTQAGGSRPVNNRLHLLRIWLDAIPANNVTQVGGSV